MESPVEYKKAADLVTGSYYRLENGYLKDGVSEFDKVMQYLKTEHGSCYFTSRKGITWAFGVSTIDPVERLAYYFVSGPVPAPPPAPAEK